MTNSEEGPVGIAVSDEVHCLSRKTSREFEIHHRLASHDGHVNNSVSKLIAATDLLSQPPLSSSPSHLFGISDFALLVARAVRQDPTSAGQVIS